MIEMELMVERYFEEKRRARNEELKRELERVVSFEQLLNELAALEIRPKKQGEKASFAEISAV